MAIHGVLLATSPAPTSDDVTEIFMWLGALAVLVVIGGVAIWLIRRSLRQADDVSAQEGFSLQQLRELHASGALSDDEYERAKAAIIGRVSGREGDESRGDEPDAGEPDRPPPDAEKP